MICVENSSSLTTYARTPSVCRAKTNISIRPRFSRELARFVTPRTREKEKKFQRATLLQLTMRIHEIIVNIRLTFQRDFPRRSPRQAANRKRRDIWKVAFRDGHFTFRGSYQQIEKKKERNLPRSNRRQRSRQGEKIILTRYIPKLADIRLTFLESTRLARGIQV